MYGWATLAITIKVHCRAHGSWLVNCDATSQLWRLWLSCNVSLRNGKRGRTVVHDVKKYFFVCLFCFWHGGRLIRSALSQILVAPARADAMDERRPVPLVLYRIAVPTTTAQIASWSFPIIKVMYRDYEKWCDINEKNKNYHVFQSRCSVGPILTDTNLLYDDVIKWKHFPCYWPFVREIHWSLVNSPHKGQWPGALMVSLICVWTNSWTNNRDAGNLRRRRAHYVM